MDVDTAYRKVLILSLILSLSANAYLWDKWTHAQGYIADKRRVSDGDYAVLIANETFICWERDNESR